MNCIIEIKEQNISLINIANIFLLLQIYHSNYIIRRWNKEILKKISLFQKNNVLSDNIGLVVEVIHDNDIYFIKKYNISNISCNYKNIKLTDIHKLQNLNVYILAYTVNTTQMKNKLFSMGVNYVYSDYPNI
jgi:hypothetical protein